MGFALVFAVQIVRGHDALVRAENCPSRRRAEVAVERVEWLAAAAITSSSDSFMLHFMSR